MTRYNCRKCGELLPEGVSHRSNCEKCVKADIAARQRREVARYHIYERDDFCCVYCGASPIEGGAKLVIEHIIPKSRGGDNSAYNTITACWDCNTRKADKQLQPEVYARILWQLEAKNGKMNPLTLAVVENVFNEIFGITDY